jgi:ADP-ribosylglycohydrolase
MKMPGGGTFRLKAGQVTDDSEMAMHMLRGLLHYSITAPLETQTWNLLLCIAKEYIDWYNSNPFDIGLTCSAALRKLSQLIPAEGDQMESMDKTIILIQAFKEIATTNKSSLSNGFLMRITPMACFHALISLVSDKEEESLKQLIRGDIKMTHGHSLCF